MAAVSDTASVEYRATRRDDGARTRRGPDADVWLTLRLDTHCRQTSAGTPPVHTARAPTKHPSRDSPKVLLRDRTTIDSAAPHIPTTAAHASCVPRTPNAPTSRESIPANSSVRLGGAAIVASGAKCLCR